MLPQGLTLQGKYSACFIPRLVPGRLSAWLKGVSSEYLLNFHIVCVRPYLVSTGAGRVTALGVLFGICRV